MRLLASLFALVFVAATGCAHAPSAVAPAAPAQPAVTAAAPAPQPVVEPAVTTAAAVTEEAPQAVPAVATAPAQAVADEADAQDDADDVAADDEDAAPEGEGEAFDPAATTDNGLHYTDDLPDDQLKAFWKDEPQKLGSVSFGFVDEGRLFNAVRFPASENGEWTVVDPGRTYATQETVDYVISAIREVRKQFPAAPPLRVNQISGPEGGYLRPHKSHQNGRDVDLAFYYPTAEPVRARERERYIDVEKNWALLKALVTLTDVQFVLVDRRVQKVIYDYALAAGEDKAWLDSLFRSANPLVKHARGHRDHFHVRFYNARAQELGRRLSPFLALRPEQNVLMHRVKSGDTLGHLAVRYGTSVSAIMKANRMRSTFLRLRMVLKIPLRKPCTQCPIPPAVVLPPRHLPPPSSLPTVSAPVSPATAPLEASATAAPLSPSPVQGAGAILANATQTATVAPANATTSPTPLSPSHVEGAPSPAAPLPLAADTAAGGSGAAAAAN